MGVHSYNFLSEVLNVRGAPSVSKKPKKRQREYYTSNSLDVKDFYCDIWEVFNGY